MNIKEYHEVMEVEPIEQIIKGNQLSMDNQKDRTLIFGYTPNRNSFHVYMIRGVIYGIIYNESVVVHTFSEWEVSENREYVPTKRIYPECCDMEFCTLLAKSGVILPFTTFSEKRKYNEFYGKIQDRHLGY